MVKWVSASFRHPKSKRTSMFTWTTKQKRVTWRDTHICPFPLAPQKNKRVTWRDAHICPFPLAPQTKKRVTWRDAHICPFPLAPSCFCDVTLRGHVRLLGILQYIFLRDFNPINIWFIITILFLLGYLTDLSARAETPLTWCSTLNLRFCGCARVMSAVGVVIFTVT